MDETEFRGFPKMARLSREIIITEKIDGTNAQIFITDDGRMLVGSRTQWITPENDNHGFAAWVKEHQEQLLKLGPGRHFGEWWGCGINRGYGLLKGEKRLSLFNVQRWCLFGHVPARIETADPRIEKYQDVLPECVGLVPILWRGNFDKATIGLCDNHCIKFLQQHGSVAAPGFMNPEGIVIFHVAGNVGFKKTIKNDENPKSKAS